MLEVIIPKKEIYIYIPNGIRQYFMKLKNINITCQVLSFACATNTAKVI